MLFYEDLSFTIAFAAYTLAILLNLWHLASQRPSSSQLATGVTALGWGCHTLAIILRTVNAGRLPLANGYEFLVTFAWSIILFYLYLEFRYRLKGVGWPVLPVVWILFVYAAIVIPDSQKATAPLMPALKSHWLSLHVTTAILSYGALTISFALALLFLLKERFTGSGNRWLRWAPDQETLDGYCYQFVTFGFFLLSLVIITGAIWAEQAWGSYWSWDPKETWSLITWLIYGACLHVRQTYGWRGRRSSIIAVIGFAAVLFTLFGVNYWLVGLHSYA